MLRTANVPTISVRMLPFDQDLDVEVGGGAVVSFSFPDGVRGSVTADANLRPVSLLNIDEAHRDALLTAATGDAYTILSQARQPVYEE